MCVLSNSVMSLCSPMGCSPPGSSVHGILQARILEWVATPSSRGSSQPRDQTQSPTLQVDSLPSEPLGKFMNTGVGNLSLLQGIFPTQELNWGLLHCRQILYQLIYQGSLGGPYLYLNICSLLTNDGSGPCSRGNGPCWFYAQSHPHC